MTSSIQYLTTAHNGYILPSDTAQMEHYAAPGGVHLTMAHNGVAGGVQKLVAVQPMTGAAQQRAAGLMQTGGGTTIYHSGMQKFVALQPMAIPNGAQRTYAGGTTYLHQAAPQPRPQQLAAGTQIINAFNAEGQPVTIAINPNGTHSVLSSSTLAMPSNGQPVQSQQVQMRQVPAATTLITSQAQGQRIVQLPNGEFQAVQAGGAPGIYKVVQQGGPVQAGDRFVVQTSQGQQLVQRFMPSQGTAMPIKQANGVPQIAMRSTAAPVATMMAQPSSIQMGRSLIHMPSRPSTTTTAYTTAAPVQTMRPNPNILGMAKLPQAKQPIKQMQQMQQLPSTILVRPAGSTDSGLSQVLQQQASGTPSMQPQSVQQQVKDTAAQQRQQQLLASLRARVASLHHVQGGQAVLRPAGMPQAQTVIGPGGQIRRLVAVGEQPAGPATTAMHLQPDGNLVNLQTSRVMVNGNGQHQTQHSSIDSQSLLSLTPAQQQALMSGQSLDSQGMMVSQLVDDNQALLAGQTMEQQAMMVRQQADRQALAQQQRNAMREAMISPGMTSNDEATQALAPGQLVLMPSSGSGVNTPSPTTMLTRGLDGKSIQRPFGQPASPSGSVGKEDLRAILLSIGAELARHGIDVETAVDAGWLGVLSPTDVAVLQEAYAMEERNLAMEGPEARSRMGREASQASFGADEHGRMPTLEANSFIGAGSITSRGSPAASIMSNGVLDAVWTPPAEPPMQLTDIDDARFSAFAYDFFGSHDNGGDAPGDFLEALEPDAAGKFNCTVSAMAGSAGSGHSSIATAPPGDGVVAPPLRAAPVRAPSWPSANKPGPTGPLQVDDQSMASFSDMCTASMPVNGANHEAGSDSVSTSSSNQELVARIANLDLGCGFY